MTNLKKFSLAPKPFVFGQIADLDRTTVDKLYEKMALDDRAFKTALFEETERTGVRLLHSVYMTWFVRWSDVQSQEGRSCQDTVAEGEIAADREVDDLCRCATELRRAVIVAGYCSGKCDRIRPGCVVVFSATA